MAAVRQLLSPPGIGMTGRSWLLGAILRPTRSCPNLPRHGLTQQTPAAAAPTRLGSCSELCAPVLQELHPDPSLCSTRVELGPRRGRVAAAPRPLGFWSCRDRRTEDAPRLCLVTGTCSHIHRENKASSVEPAASAYRHPDCSSSLFLPFSNEWLHLRESCRWFSGDARARLLSAANGGGRARKQRLRSKFLHFPFNSRLFTSSYFF